MNDYWCDLGSIPVWENQTQCYRIREHYKYRKGTQKNTHISDVNTYMPQRKSHSKSTITPDKDNKNKYRAKTWHLITDMYGDTDTTEIWDDYIKAPAATFESTQPDKYDQINKEFKKDVTVNNNKKVTLKTKIKNKKMKQVVKPTTNSELIQHYENIDVRNIGENHKINSSINSMKVKIQLKEDQNYSRIPKNSNNNKDKNNTFHLPGNRENYDRVKGKLRKREIKPKVKYDICNCKRNECSYEDEVFNIQKNQYSNQIKNVSPHKRKDPDTLKSPSDIVSNSKKENIRRSIINKMLCKWKIINPPKLEKCLDIKVNQDMTDFQSAISKRKIPTYLLEVQHTKKKKNFENGGKGDTMEDITIDRTVHDVRNKNKSDLKKETAKTGKRKQVKINLRECPQNYKDEIYEEIPKNSKRNHDEPLFEIKVRAPDLHVINPIEVRDQVMTLAKSKKNDTCLCKSRLKRIKSQVCNAGICEEAHRQKDKKFVCNCKRGNLKDIECNDLTCNRKHIFTKNTIERTTKSASKDKQSMKPLFEVILDDTDMNIVNSDEISDIFAKSSYNQICADGICRIAKKKNIESNCKCIGKKIPYITHECSNATCNVRPFTSKLSNFCLKMFCKSDNWTRYPYRGRHRKINTIHKRQSLNIGKNLHHRDTMYLSKRKKKRKKNKKKKRKRKKKLKQRIKDCISKLTNTKENEELQRQIELSQMNCEERTQFCIEENREKCKEKVKEKHEIYKDKDKKAKIELDKKIDRIKRERESDGHHSTVLNDVIAGPFNLLIRSIKQVFVSTFYLVVDPIGSYVYVKEKVKNPVSTIQTFRKWLFKTWHSKTVFLSSILKKSHALNVLSDHVEDNPIFEAVVSSRRSAKELARQERKATLRKKRIQERHDAALFGCRHILLTTMRKTPCLWFYHIYPDLYPQCLAFVNFLTNFIHIIIYLIAIILWTPCILSCEICRALLCCLVCTS